MTAAPAPGSRASRSRGREEWSLWVAREGVGGGDGGDTILGGQGERVASPPTAQQPRNLATELSTTSFLSIILAGKGDITEVLGQLKQLKHHFFFKNEKENESFHFLLN